MRATMFTFALIALWTSAAHAQRMLPALATSTPSFRTEVTDSADDRTGAMAMSGILGGLGGIMVGGFFGSGTSSYRGYTYSLMAGEALGVPLGVRLASCRRGNYGKEVLASAAILLGGVLAAQRLARQPAGCRDCGGYLLLFGVPIAQIAASIAIERSTARRGP